jgi:hypothetical protein
MTEAEIDYVARKLVRIAGLIGALVLILLG